MSDLVTHCFDAWGVTLIMPRTMSLEDMDDIMILTNGCGREGAENRLVPDSILGLDISPACRVHDWMYEDAQEETDEPAALAAEIEADAVFAANLDGIICQKSGNKLMRWLRLQIAHWYIDAVSCTDIVSPKLLAGVTNAQK